MCVALVATEYGTHMGQDHAGWRFGRSGIHMRETPQQDFASMGVRKNMCVCVCSILFTTFCMLYRTSLICYMLYFIIIHNILYVLCVFFCFNEYVQAKHVDDLSSGSAQRWSRKSLPVPWQPWVQWVIQLAELWAIGQSLRPEFYPDFILISHEKPFWTWRWTTWI